MRRRWLIFDLALIILLIGGVIIYLRNRVNFDDLSIDQLESGGYYAYVLPDKVTDESGWTRTIKMNSFDYQCDSLRNDHWNPVRISYKDVGSNPLFEMLIEEQDALFEDSKATDVVTVNADWIPTRTGIAYPPSAGTRLKVHDGLGMEVVFTSWMKLEYLLKIIPMLQYAGTSVDQVSNPWKKACGI